VRAVAPRAVLVFAGAAQRDLLERAARELDITPRRLVGTAGEALVSAAIAVVALELDVSPRDVALTVLGCPPQHVVVAWQAASVAGSPLTTAISEPARRRLDRRIRALWPAAPYALAAAACKAVAAIGGISRRRVTCFVAPDEGPAVRTRAVALPVRLTAAGVAEILVPELSSAERIALDNAMLL
jgi:malate/lactate dehydrogenase